ncbi:hypothetical protein PM082_015364 [Marasmius tenuissimus]|nr:hypothetical protein PM082_015364 [Marasmius tenuissimus]
MRAPRPEQLLPRPPCRSFDTRSRTLLNHHKFTSVDAANTPFDCEASPSDFSSALSKGSRTTIATPLKPSSPPKITYNSPCDAAHPRQFRSPLIINLTLNGLAGGLNILYNANDADRLGVSRSMQSGIMLKTGSTGWTTGFSLIGPLKTKQDENSPSTQRE